MAYYAPYQEVFNLYNEYINSATLSLEWIEERKEEPFYIFSHSNDYPHILKNAATSQMFIVEEVEDKWVLLDGFNRLFILNYLETSFDCDVVIKVYKELTDIHTFELLYNLNNYKYKLHEKGFNGVLNRGISFYLLRKYNLNVALVHEGLQALLNMYGGSNKIYGKNVKNGETGLEGVFVNNSKIVNDLKEIVILPNYFDGKVYNLYSRSKEVKESRTVELERAYNSIWNLFEMLVSTLSNIRIYEYDNGLENKEIPLLDLYNGINFTEKEMYELLGKEVTGHTENYLKRKVLPRLVEYIFNTYGYELTIPKY